MEKKSIGALIILLLICFVFPVFIFAETIVLRSGARIEGKVIETNDKDKYIRVDVNGSILKYNFSDIEMIDHISDAQRKQNEIRTDYLEDHFKKIKKGITSEKEILGWFGQPHEIIKSNTSKEDFPDEIIRGGYPVPKYNQEILRYEYSFCEIYTGNLGAEGYEIIFMITINKDTRLVEECKNYFYKWMS